MDVDSIVQSIATIISGSIIGLIFQWKLALVGIACIPLLISTGFIRLVFFWILLAYKISNNFSTACRRLEGPIQQESTR